MGLDDALVDRGESYCILGKLRIGFNTHNAEVLFGNAQKIAARAAHFQEFSRRLEHPDQIQTGLRVHPGQPAFLIKINAGKAAIGLANAIGDCGRGI
jgi:hypothetical protein